MSKKKTIVIDAGHGGVDPGAVNGELGIKESDVALQYGLTLYWYLAKNYTLKMIRERDVFVTLADRVKMANAFKADLFVSLHLNSAENPKARGFEIWTSKGQTESDRAATEVFHRIRSAFPALAPREDWSDGDPDKEAGYYVLRKTRMPAILIELGFVCNNIEAKWLTSPDVMNKYVEAIAMGLEQWAEGGV